MLLLRIVTIVSLMVFSGCMSAKEHRETKEYGESVLNQVGEPSKMLEKLLALLEVEHDGTLDSIVEATQKAWLRPVGSERWEFADKYAQKRDEIMPLLEKLNCIYDILPSRRSYDYALMLGATVHRVRTRLAYLVTLWEQGVRFKSIIFATGARTLDPQKESQDALLTSDVAGLPIREDWVFSGMLPTTETDMMKLVYEQSVLPDDMRQVPVVFVDTPMQPTAHNGLRRPNTGDTIIKWMSTRPTSGSCLVISNQPFVGYQDSVVRTFLPDSFTIETVGHSAHKEISVSVCLDTIARWLYQERKRRSQS